LLDISIPILQEIVLKQAKSQYPSKPLILELLAALTQPFKRTRLNYGLAWAMAPGIRRKMMGRIMGLLLAELVLMES
jgi:hypothetical protein